MATWLCHHHHHLFSSLAHHHSPTTAAHPPTRPTPSLSAQPSNEVGPLARGPPPTVTCHQCTSLPMKPTPWPHLLPAQLTSHEAHYTTMTSCCLPTCPNKTPTLVQPPMRPSHCHSASNHLQPTQPTSSEACYPATTSYPCKSPIQSGLDDHLFGDLEHLFHSASKNCRFV